MGMNTNRQTPADKAILEQVGHPQGPQYIGPRQVDCIHYDEHRYSFYRDSTGRWQCPLEDEDERIPFGISIR